MIDLITLGIFCLFVGFALPALVSLTQTVKRIEEKLNDHDVDAP